MTLTGRLWHRRLDAEICRFVRTASLMSVPHTAEPMQGYSTVGRLGTEAHVFAASSDIATGLLLVSLKRWLRFRGQEKIAFVLYPHFVWQRAIAEPGESYGVSAKHKHSVIRFVARLCTIRCRKQRPCAVHEIHQSTKLCAWKALLNREGGARMSPQPVESTGPENV